MLKEVLYDSFENLEIKTISLENPASVDGKIFFLIRIFYLSAAVAIAIYFWNIRLKILWSPSFNSERSDFSKHNSAVR